MKTPLPVMDERTRSALRATVDDAPLPAALRARVLRRHAMRRTANRAAPFVAISMLTLSLAMISDPRGQALDALQARSMALEATWQAQGDRAWLLTDARAQPLLYRLREVDSAIAGLSGSPDPDADTLERLWHERTQTLAALVDTRRQGGLAVQL